MKPKIDSLESERLLLEIRQESHAAELYPFFCNRDLYHYTKRDIPPSASWLATGFKTLETCSSPDGQEQWLGWIGREKSTQRPVGVFEMSVVGHEAFVAYTVFKDFWGQGYAVEASKEMIQFISKNYPVKKFVIEMDTRNRASAKVAEKLGFEFVKVINNACFLKNFVSHEFQFQKKV
ncbi:MAG: GNAT family N-acetyltransferase [Bacteriovoracaceae bacterium]